MARAEADWLVGMNGTRALTCKYNAQLSCGRVQTPTLAMIAKREEEIRAFKPKEYYGITLKAGDITWTWKEPKSKSFRTFNKERAVGDFRCSQKSVSGSNFRNQQREKILCTGFV